MSHLTNLGDAARELASIFRELAGGDPHVALVGRDEERRPVVAVRYEGDELVRAMQIEAFAVRQGSIIRQRSQKKGAYTILVYAIAKP